MGVPVPEGNMNPTPQSQHVALPSGEASVTASSIYSYGEETPNTPKSSKLPLGLHKAMRRRSLGTQVVDASEISAGPGCDNSYSSLFNNSTSNYSSSFNLLSTSGIITLDDASDHQSRGGRPTDASMTSLSEDKQQNSHSSHSSMRPRSSSRGARRRGSLYVAHSSSQNASPASGHQRKRAQRRSSLDSMSMRDALAALPTEASDGDRSYRRTRRSSLGSMPTNFSLSPFPPIAVSAKAEEGKNNRRTRRNSPSPLSDSVLSTVASAELGAEKRPHHRTRRNSLDAAVLPFANVKDATTSALHRLETEQKPKKSARRRNSVSHYPVSGSINRKEEVAPPKNVSSSPASAEGRKEKRTARRNSLAGVPLSSTPGSSERYSRASRWSSVGDQPMRIFLDSTRNVVDTDAEQSIAKRRTSLSMKRVLNNQDSISPTAEKSESDPQEYSASLFQLWREATIADANFLARKGVHDSSYKSGENSATSSAVIGTLNCKKKSVKHKAKTESLFRPPVRANSSSGSSKTPKFENLSHLKHKERKVVPIVVDISVQAAPPQEVRRSKSAFASTTRPHETDERPIKKGFLKKWLGNPSMSFKKY